jgi:hypothetical protein
MTYADLLFTGGPVLTVDAAGTGPARPPSGTGGSSPSATTSTSCAGPARRSSTSPGGCSCRASRTLHVHAVFGGLEMGLCDLTGTVELADYLSRIRAYAEAIDATSVAETDVSGRPVFRAA